MSQSPRAIFQSFGQFFDRGGKIGVAEQTPFAACLHHSVTDGKAFAAIAWISQNTNIRVALLQSLPRLRLSIVRTVIDDRISWKSQGSIPEYPSWLNVSPADWLVRYRPEQ